MKIESNELDFYEWSIAPPRVACGSQLGPFFPLTCLTPSLQLSHPLFTQSQLHNFPQLSHPLTLHLPQQHALTIMFYIYLYFSYVIYLLCHVFTILEIYFC